MTEFKYGTSKKSLSQGKIPVLRMGNITCIGTIDYTNLVYSSNEEDIEQYLLQKGDLVFNRTNSSELVGKTAIYKEDMPAIYAGYLIRIRPILLESEYLNFVMNSSYYKEWCYYIKTGAVNQSNINAQKLSQLDIPIPPFEEQQRIATEIELWFKWINELEQSKQELQDVIKLAKSKILDLAIHGKLVPQDPNDEPASELLKRVNPSAKITCDNPHYENLPKGWCIVPMSVICQLQDGKYENDIERINLDVKYLRNKSNGKRIMRGKYVSANSTLILVDGENSGEIFTAKIEGYQGSTFKLLSISNEINSTFVLYVIRSYQKLFRESKVGSAIPHLNKKLFKEILVFIPPINEQKQIVTTIKEYFVILDNIAAEL